MNNESISLEVFSSFHSPPISFSSRLRSFFSKYGYYLILLCLFLASLSEFTHYTNTRSLRKLSEEKANLLENETLMNETEIRKKYNNDYQFLSNLTLYEYKGKWSDLVLPQKIFDTDKGNTEIYFGKIKNENFITQNNSFKTVFILKDGKYIDHYIRANFTTVFPNNFSSILEKNENKVTITNYNTSINLLVCEFLANYTQYNLNETNITLVFHNAEKAIQNSFSSMFISKFSHVDFNITHKNFSVLLNGEISYSTEIESKLRNYSFILTIIAFIEIYYLFFLLMQVNENNQIGLNLDLVTVAVSLLYKSFICSTHFYLSITTKDDGLSYQYGIPSLIYFFAFSSFDLRLLFFSWKSRYADLLLMNPNLFKRKLFYFYLSFYVILFLSLISIRTIITNTFTCFVLFISTWLFQIIHSARTGTRPPYRTGYIFLSTLGRLYLPMYLKAYDGNIFELRPSYLKVAIIIGIVVLEVLVLLVQKNFGGKAIVPSCWKTVPYNYYRDSVNIEEHISKNPDCVICLEDLKKEPEMDYIEDNKQEEEMHFQRRIANRIKKVLCIGPWFEKIDKWFNPQKKKKKYMITPCDHVFHTVCLEKWMMIKNECPYCRRKIPPVE